MDNRSEQILKYLLYNANVDSKTLLKEFSITRNQLDYSVKKINIWCEEHGYPEIKRLRNGSIYVPYDLINGLKKGETNHEPAESSFIYSEKERGKIMLLMILMKRDYLSLDHFMIDLDISKNTALRTLQYLRKSLPEGITIFYSRSQGYELVGNEWDIRTLIIKTVSFLKKMTYGEEILQHYIFLAKGEIQQFHEVLKDAEKTLNVKFSDERIEILPYILMIIDYRIQKGFVIQESFHINNSMLADTREYAVASEMFENWKNIPDQEKLFITLQLLTTNIIAGDLLTEKLSQNLSLIIEECLTNFERLACVTLKNKEYLRERMLLHMRPAFYRIKYQMNLKMKMDDLEIDPKYDALKGLIREAFQPLQTFIGAKIPDEEFTFIAIFVLSALSNAKEAAIDCKAVVVCKSGVIISQALNTFLQKIFPEFIFLPPCSARDFPNVAHQADIVFSTVPLKGAERLFLVKPIMTNRELELLKNRVLNELNGVFQQDLNMISLAQIMQIVEQHAEVKNKKQLEEGLANLFHKTIDLKSIDSRQQNSLAQLLISGGVQIVDQVADYKEAIQIASQPLLEKKVISKDYVQAIMEAHDFNDSYIVLGSEIAIPHAKPEAGVNKLGISLLYVKEGVQFAEDADVHFVFVIAPVDQEQHINALFEIMNIAENEVVLDQLKTSTTPIELRKMITILSESEEAE